MQASHTGRGIDFALVAEACGWAAEQSLHTIAEVDGLRETLRAPSQGPRLFLLKIAAETLPRSLPPRNAVHVKNRFRAALGFGVT